MKLIFSMWLCLFVMTPGKLVPKRVANGITVPIPDTLRAMNKQEMALQSPSVRAPLAAFTSENRLVDFTVNLSATQWPDNDLVLAKTMFKSGVENLFDRVDYIQEDIREVRGRKYIYLEFESRIKGTKYKMGQRNAVLQYHVVQYLVLPNRTLVFSFHCPRTLRDKWEDTVHQMMAGVQVKK